MELCFGGASFQRADNRRSHACCVASRTSTHKRARVAPTTRPGTPGRRVTVGSGHSGSDLSAYGTVAKTDTRQTGFASRCIIA